MGLTTFMLAATFARARFESGLRLRYGDGRVLTMKDMQRRLKNARPLLTLLERVELEDDTGRPLFRALVREIEEAAKMCTDLIAETPRPSRGRLGEQWARPSIEELALLLRACGQSWRAITRQIFTAFEVWGHGDVISQEIVRRIIRTCKDAIKASVETSAQRQEIPWLIRDEPMPDWFRDEFLPER